MLLRYTNEQLATVVGVPVVSILLLWTLTIYHKNRRRWATHDVVVAAVLAQSVVRNASLLVYTAFAIADVDGYCKLVIWLFHSVHAFQACTLTTLAVVAAFPASLPHAHVVYHLCCLTVLCSCVGVAAILAEPLPYAGLCPYMPYEFDLKFSVFVVVLHTFLAGVAVAALARVASRRLRQRDFDRLDKATSNLSLSDVSMTVSSTNSRRPCLRKPEEHDGLHTVLPVLAVCYLFNHLPLIVLSSYPRLIAPWNVAGVALWTCQLQDVLIPIGLALVDARFGVWVASVYKCEEADKIPAGVDLDGKFRRCGSEVTQQRTRFPITNGSLYTIVQNYRGARTATVSSPPPPHPREDDYFSDDATSRSSFSITTEANGDFDFYQTKSAELLNKAARPEVSQLRITRSNSKRSLESFQAYVEESAGKVQRSNSLVMDEGGVATPYLTCVGGSVPDFKRVFISDYI